MYLPAHPDHYIDEADFDDDLLHPVAPSNFFKKKYTYKPINKARVLQEQYNIASIIQEC